MTPRAMQDLSSVVLHKKSSRNPRLEILSLKITFLSVFQKYLITDAAVLPADGGGGGLLLLKS